MQKAAQTQNRGHLEGLERGLAAHAAYVGGETPPGGQKYPEAIPEGHSEPGTVHVPTGKSRKPSNSQGISRVHSEDHCFTGRKSLVLN